ncbi:DUF3606 domain-containing protein [Pseudoxanthomonas sp. z9]|uniref:DUF3606 domain-containing protein n=1 Tax=Pseudoxanthomonas sp. z9 TaxID=2584942 RepID=UPI0011446D2F|nr:DUF3606 domain-containing protein [Pseudoxanthomonas sp. z9]MCL6711472.1 DUF3606 domain-containing protein [Pseudomonas sp. R2.Fl]
MSDDLTQRGEPDRSRIALNEDHEIRYWTERFGVSEGRLREAVKSVGNSADDVGEWLKGNT